jgi:hypothetical protein
LRIGKDDEQRYELAFGNNTKVFNFAIDSKGIGSLVLEREIEHITSIVVSAESTSLPPRLPQYAVIFALSQKL